MDRSIPDVKSKDIILSEQALELVKLWREEAEVIALDYAGLARKRGYTKGAAEWERIAVLSAEWWSEMAGND